MADDSDDDPVVDEIDVFLSKSLSDNLYLMQYPLRPRGMTYDSCDQRSARVKPKQKRVELTLGLDTHSKNYSSSRGEQIAVNVDGDLPLQSPEKFFSSHKMDKIILSCPPQTQSFKNVQYAVGLLKEGELHLTPMDAVVQMRPSLEYMDRADSKCRTEQRNTAQADGGESSQDEGEEEATPVSMKVAHAESEEFKARRMASYEYINQKREEERWQNLTFHPSDSALCETERQQLQAGDVPLVSQFKLSAQEYLSVLIPPSCENKSETPAMPDNVLSLNELRKLDLHDQIKQLLINVKVIRFSQLIGFLAPGTDHQAVLRSLQSMAVLVQGCWVVKSEYLYPDEDKGEGKIKRRERAVSLGPELYRRVRDYAMWKFTHCKYVVRKDISHIVQLPSDDVKEILEKMSRLKARNGWEFLYEYDRDFCERYPEVVQRQRNKWALTFHSLAQYFKMPKDGDKKALESEMTLMNQQPTERHRTRKLSTRSPRKRTLSGRSQSDISDIEMDGIGDKGHYSDKQRGKEGRETPESRKPVDSGESVPINGYGSVPSASMPNGIILSNHEASGIASFKDAVCCDNTSSTTEDLETFAREMLLQHSSVNMSEIRNKLSHYAAKGGAFKQGVSDKMLEDAIVGVGGVKLNNKWPPKQRAEPLFGFFTGNEKMDKLRRILFSMFDESCKLRLPSFRARLSAELDFEVSEAEVKKFLKDHCEYVSSQYYLKGTLNS